MNNMENKASHKQAFFFTIINYVGIIIGIFSTLFIYPKNKELLGIFRFVEAISQILYPILLLGASQALINFAPKFNEIQKKQLLNYSVLSIFSIGFLVFVIIFIASKTIFFSDLSYLYFAFPVGFCLAMIELFKKQSAIIQKIAVPTFFDTIIPKITLPIVFLLVLNHFFGTKQSLYFYIFSYFAILFFIFVYVSFHFKPSLNFNFKTLFGLVSKKEYYRFSLYSFAGSLGSVFAFRIDALMIPRFISMEALGTFSIGVTLASALAVPATGIFALYAPLISNFIKKDNFSELNSKYKEVAKLLFFIGALLYSCIFLGIENLFLMLPTHENLMGSIPVILILGFNVLVNMGTGFNGEIITYSKFYKFNLIAILVLIVLNVSLNLFFINFLKLGIEGVAWASLISMVVFNISKLIFIYKKFQLFPFDFDYFKMVLVFCLSLLLIYLLPNFNSNFYNFLFKIVVSLTLNIFLIYQFKLVFQVTQFCNKIKNYIL
jgi:O-antigen/teichoic acid export membrane protein